MTAGATTPADEIEGALTVPLPTRLVGPRLSADPKLSVPPDKAKLPAVVVKVLLNVSALPEATAMTPLLVKGTLKVVALLVLA